MHAPGYILVGYRRLLHVRLIPDTNRSLLMHARAEVKSRFFIYVSYTADSSVNSNNSNRSICVCES